MDKVKTSWLKLFNLYEQKTNTKLLNYPKDDEVYPSTDNIFNCFTYFEPEETKIVIIGQDPYHTEGQATGLAFECGSTLLTKTGKPKEQPSLKNIKEVLGVKTIDFKSWASNGVLLLNSALTVEKGKPGSHMKFWLPFTKFLIDFLNKETKCIFVCWGAFAKNLCLDVDQSRMLSCGHPSPMANLSKSKNFIPFKESNIFNKIEEKTGIDLSKV